MKNIFLTLEDLRLKTVEFMKKTPTTQAKLAKYIGVSQSQLSKFLAQKKELKGRAVLRLQAFLLSEDGGENGEEQ